MSCTETVAVQFESNGDSDRPMSLRLRAFRAVDEPATCAEFLTGHRQALQAYRISELASANETWTENPYTFVLVAEDLDEGTMLGGIRLHLADGQFLLPTEEAVGKLDPRLGEKIRADQPHRAGEICGTWRSPQAAILRGLVPEMAVSVIAMTQPLGVRRVWGLAPTHTLHFWQRLGYRVDPTLGQDGGFAYPDSRYVSSVVYLDTVRLSRTPLAVRHRIADLQQRPIQQRQIEFPCGVADVDFDLSILRRVTLPMWTQQRIAC